MPSPGRGRPLPPGGAGVTTVEEVTDETFLESYVHLKKGPEFIVLFYHGCAARQLHASCCYPAQLHPAPRATARLMAAALQGCRAASRGNRRKRSAGPPDPSGKTQHGGPAEAFGSLWDPGESSREDPRGPPPLVLAVLLPAHGRL